MKALPGINTTHTTAARNTRAGRFGRRFFAHTGRAASVDRPALLHFAQHQRGGCIARWQSNTGGHPRIGRGARAAEIGPLRDCLDLLGWGTDARPAPALLFVLDHHGHCRPGTEAARAALAKAEPPKTDNAQAASSA